MDVNAPIMGYERFIFWLWKSSTTDACKVKNTLIVLYAFIFTLLAQRLPNDSCLQTPPLWDANLRWLVDFI